MSISLRSPTNQHSIHPSSKAATARSVICSRSEAAVAMEEEPQQQQQWNNEEKKKKKELDAVVFGASGFTGKHVVRYLLGVAAAHRPDLRIGVAGRSRSRLADAVRWASPLSLPVAVSILEADVSDPDSLQRLCARTRLVLACVGPFRLYGEPVVAACVAAGVDYLDITGEPEFMERMEALFHDRAVESGSLVVSACGFDSIPAEIGLFHHTRQWEAPAVPNSVTAYGELISEKRIVGNLGTYESAVLGVAHADELHKFRRSRPRRARPNIPGPPAGKGKLLENNKDLGIWAMKLPSADSIVVRRTQSLLTSNPHGLPGLNESSDFAEQRRRFWSQVKPVHFGVSVGYKSLLGVLRVVLLGAMLVILGKFGWGRSLLLKYPEIFSLGMFRKTGPTEEEINSASFRMTFVGKGYSDQSVLQRPNAKPDKEIVTRLSGPEVAYAATPIVLVQCALVLLLQRKNLPKGGVFTPGAVFGPTDLQERLHEDGIAFEVLKK